MASRPDYIDLRTPQGDAMLRLARGALSPRIEHFDGEIPPALSPLDAFAAQGRLLAKQLDESMRKDRRMSRLPPSSVARSLSQPRPGYFRSPASDHSRRVARSPEHGASPAVEEPKIRPQSEHPRLSGLSVLRSEDGNEDFDLTPVTRRLEDQARGSDYFGVPRAESPEQDLAMGPDHQDEIALPAASRGSSTDSSRPQISTTLAPPISPMPQSYNNPRYMQPESSDDDYTSSNAGSTFSKPRKLSSSSGMSMPHSPMSPFTRPHPRSPSISSEISNTGSYLPRPSFNFSRPLSRSSTSLSVSSPLIPYEPPAPSNQQSIGIKRENKPAPIDVPTPDVAKIADEKAPSSAVSSYIYAKYSLPRGRMVSRNSLVFSGLQTPHFEWKEPLFEKSPPSRRSSSRAGTPSPAPAPQDMTSKTPEKSPHQKSSVHTSPSPSGVQPADGSSTTQRPSLEVRHGLPRSYTDNLDETKSMSADSDSTIRPQTGRTGVSSVINTSAEDHVAKGVECHEKGALQESTYHLRIAAKQGHPTGMLLYALACRHGWGMRPNQREGVQWLRKAVDCAGLEMVDDDTIPGTKEDAAARKARRAQFALGIYELGVSHLNGWGIEQDKALALRCFEIAGQWGDPDALAEAGFCYVEGVGCKKDLKKAARYYRLAEAKGISMVGNSWYATVSLLVQMEITNDF
jgi:TPR repeat protein